MTLKWFLIEEIDWFVLILCVAYHRLSFISLFVFDFWIGMFAMWMSFSTSSFVDCSLLHVNSCDLWSIMVRLS